MDSPEELMPAEIWQGLQDRIMSKEEFKNKLENDPEFRQNIAGCTSLGINHVAKGVMGDKISIQRYYHPVDKKPKVNLIPNENIFVTLFPEETNFADAFYGEGGYDWIEDNQNYGRTWAISELLLQRGISPFIPNPFYHEIDTILINTPSLNSADSLQDVQTILENLSNSRAGNIADTVEHAQSTLGGSAQLAQILHEVKERKGVQIIYGNPTEFTKYIRGGILDRIRGGRYETYDDVTIGLADDIPDRFILAIIPLGEYEQQMMGFTNNVESSKSKNEPAA